MWFAGPNFGYVSYVGFNTAVHLCLTVSTRSDTCVAAVHTAALSWPDAMSPGILQVMHTNTGCHDDADTELVDLCGVEPPPLKQARIAPPSTPSGKKTANLLTPGTSGNIGSPRKDSLSPDGKSLPSKVPGPTSKPECRTTFGLQTPKSTPQKPRRDLVRV